MQIHIFDKHLIALLSNFRIVVQQRQSEQL
nr:MAG TPA: hypothetical protein [Caudoviricetes sp.]